MAWYYQNYTLLTSVHNDLDDADDAGNADDYNRVIGISKCEEKIANTHPNISNHRPTHPHTQTSELADNNKLCPIVELNNSTLEWSVLNPGIVQHSVVSSTVS